MRLFFLRSFFPAVLLLSSARGDTLVAPVFGDHMVIQRDRAVPVWGTDAPDTKITVTFAGHTAIGTAGQDGKWSVKLPATSAGGPYDLVVKGSTEAHFADILAGDVWFASGQSNMAFRLKDEKYAGEAIANANHPEIRFLQVPQKASRELFRPEPKWEAATPQTATQFSAVAYYFARDLQADLKVPIGIINSSWGGTLAEAWIPLAALNADPNFKDLRAQWDKNVQHDPEVLKKYQADMKAWREAADEARKNGSEPPQKPPIVAGPNDSNTPGLLFQSMIEPFVPFALRGVIWYQGESNGWAPGERYHQLFSMLIREWRAAWAQPDLPFLFVQLPNYEAGNPAGTNWADVRGAQAQVLEMPGTGMAVTIDLGDTKDIHPKNKRDVGGRLALVARGAVYGEQIPYRGPSLDALWQKNGTIILRFVNVEKGLMISDGSELAGFEAAGIDGKFQPVAAKIEGTDTVVLSAPHAIDVRYAWHNDPQPKPNLMNSSALPAPPFRASLK